MAIAGYIVFFILGFFTPLLFGRVTIWLATSRFWQKIAFPGIGGTMGACFAGIELFVVALIFPVNPWVCWWIFAVEQFLMIPALVNPIPQTFHALVTFAAIVKVFFR